MIKRSVPNEASNRIGCSLLPTVKESKDCQLAQVFCACVGKVRIIFPMSNCEDLVFLALREQLPSSLNDIDVPSEVSGN